MKHPSRVKRCPVCNGRMEYKSFDPWTTFPKDVCSRCGYSGSFAIEWEDDGLMDDYKPANCKSRKKEAYALEKEGLRNIVRLYAILMILSWALALLMGIVIYFR
ncbi:hypothetical protein [uncultured Methanospirillum sp.]|uniref:hypothetical protein n=1 Tax=uncultured Methanospirillum sp. TaxID=262503 RepID=UPI0029C81514|nr:hypothetical protein [uncultured Methanospirillum sp.]